MSGGGPFPSAYGDSKGRIATVGSSRSPVDEHGHCGVTSKSCTREPWVYCVAQPSPYAFATCPGVVSPLSTSNHLRLEFRRVRSPCHDDLLPVCPTPSWAARSWRSTSRDSGAQLLGVISRPDPNAYVLQDPTQFHRCCPTHADAEYLIIKGCLTTASAVRWAVMS